VIATEVDKQLVSDLNKRIAREHLSNAEVILAPPSDVGIPPGTADRILLVKVWHHLPDRKHYAARVARALSPGGKVVVVDFKPGGRHGTGHGIAPERVLAELAAGGIDGALVPEDLPDQYVIIGTPRAPGATRPEPSRDAGREVRAGEAKPRRHPRPGRPGDTRWRPRRRRCRPRPYCSRTRRRCRCSPRMCRSSHRARLR